MDDSINYKSKIENEGFDEVIKEILKEFDEELGKTATLDDFIEKHIRLNSYESTKNDFKDLVDTWKASGRLYNAEDTYFKYFINNDFNSIIPQ